MRNLIAIILLTVVTASCLNEDDATERPGDGVPATSAAAKPAPLEDCHITGCAWPLVCDDLSGQCIQDGGGGTGEDGGTGGTCTPSCAPGWHCEGGTCFPGCLTSADCPPDGVCGVGGLCVYPY